MNINENLDAVTQTGGIHKHVRNYQIPRATRPTPLTSAQERLWYIYQREPASSAYNVPLVWRLRSPIAFVALRRALRLVVERHEVLRSRIREDTDGWVEEVVDGPDVYFPLIDVALNDNTEAESLAIRIAGIESRRPFDLATGERLRSLLIRITPSQHLLVLVFHHIAIDGWSTEILFQELFDIYMSYGNGGEPTLPPLSLQYGDYAAWQRQRREGKAYADDLQYWKDKLCDYHPMHLPIAYQIEPNHIEGASHAGGISGYADTILGEALRDSVFGTCQRNGVTPFVLSFAIFSMLLGRYTGSEDIAIITPITTRSTSDIQRLIGFFVNNVVLQSHIDPDWSVRAFVQAADLCVRGALIHGEFPYEDLVRLMRQMGASHGVNDSEVAFSYESRMRRVQDSPQFWIEPLSLGGRSLKFDLDFGLRETSNGIQISVEVHPRLGGTQTASLLLSRYVILLEEALRSPDRVLRDLPLLRAEEERVVLERSSGPMQPDLAEGRCVVGMIAQYAHEQPQAIAVGSSSVELSYAELDRLSSQWAQYLIEAGCEHGSRVALCLDRTPAVACLMVAVWKAGAVLVTLDPAYPVDRLASILRDAGVGLIVASRSIVSGLEGVESRLICLEEVEDDVVCLGGRDRSGQVDPHSTAYLIYTSGSTGVPKGVMISHASLSAVLRASAATFDIQRDDVMACVSSFAFDISLWELFLPLTCGARSIILRRDEVLATDRLAARLGEFTLVHAVPSLMWELLKAVRELEPDHRPRSLRQAFVGGDRVPPRLVEEMYEILPVQQVHVLYGPTETSIICASYRCDRDQKNHGAMIGRPLPNMNLRIYDQWGKLVPDGWIGELWLSGPQLAQGYYGRDDLTLERFVLRDGIQQYRTGDLARRLRDGSLEFMGRADRQTKIRGHRIEPGEIETILLAHPAVMQAIVLASELPSGEHRLAAYVTPNAGAQLATNELKRYLAIKLPSYMVPTTIQVLEALPLLPNGKVNQRALESERDQESTNSIDATSSEAPLSLTEQIVSGIWSSVLEKKDLCRQDNFFEIGGHSLSAARVVSRVRMAVRRDIQIGDLFENPTLGSFSEVVNTRLRESDEPQALIHVVEGDGAVILSSAQQQIWVLNSLDPTSSAYNVPAAFRITGSLSVIDLEASLNWLIQRHQILRTDYANGPGGPVQIVRPYHPNVLPLIDIQPVCGVDAEAVKQYIMEAELGRMFDLRRGPMMRFVLLHFSPLEHILLLTLHHIAADGWSVGIVLNELAAAYSAFHNGIPPAYPPLKLQYRDYAVWQRQSLASARIAGQLGYWKRHLLEPIAILNLPSDGVARELAENSADIQQLLVSRELSEAISNLGRAHQTTHFMTFLAIFCVLLRNSTGQEDIAVGTTYAGRTNEQLEPLIGHFVNTLVLRTDMSGNPTFADVLDRVRVSTLEAYANSEVPFEFLVEHLKPKRHARSNPFFQVAFFFQNLPATKPTLQEIEIEQVAIGKRDAKFDLTLVVVPQDGYWRVMFEYRTNRFSQATIMRLCGRFQKLIEVFCENPKQRVRQTVSLPDDERDVILRKWAAPRSATTNEESLLARFADVAKTSNGEVAIEAGHCRMTYGELDRRSSQLAHHLIACGVHVEHRVAVLVSRSELLVVSLLAILKAGATYVPLDPNYPVERRNYCLRNAGVSVVLADRTTIIENISTIMPHEINDLLVTYPTTPPPLSIKPDQLAYLIYTSGSTGLPKGVMVTHRGLDNLLCSMMREIGFHKGATFLALTTISFDIAALEIFLPLMAGGKVKLIPDVLEDYELVWQTVREAGNCYVQATPTVWRILLSHMGNLHAQEILGAKALVGGEALPVDIADKLNSSFSGVWNVYGPTETTIWSTLSLLRTGGTIDVGRPISNTTVYILDETYSPVGIGCVGEICIAGFGVARGYWNDPSATAERFIPNPFLEAREGRLYRTGDLGRWLEDGRIECLGRTDSQIKIFGQRVELGEIEDAVNSHPDVQFAVARWMPTEHNQGRLVAYYSSILDCVSSRSLREHLAKRLPRHMIPHRFVKVDRFPTTPNGKIDRRALPDDFGDSLPEVEIVPVTDATQKQLHCIWSELLGTREIGVYDDFFEIGGQSLLALQLASRITGTFGKAFTARAVFDNPTIAAMADYLQHSLATVELQSPYRLVPMTPKHSGEPLYLIHTLGGSLRPYHSLVRRLSRIQILGVEAPDLSSVGITSEPCASIEELAQEYVRLLDEQDTGGRYRLAGWSFGGVIAFHMASILSERGSEVQFLGLIDSPCPTVATAELDDDHLLFQMARDLSALLEKPIPISYREYIQAPETQRSERLLQALKRAQIVSLNTDLEFLHQRLRGFRRRAGYMRAYIPPLFEGPVTLFRAEERDGSEPGREFASSSSHDLGWQRFCAHPITIVPIAGTHVTLGTEPNVQLLAQHLRDRLNVIE